MGKGEGNLILLDDIVLMVAASWDLVALRAGEKSAVFKVRVDGVVAELNGMESLRGTSPLVRTFVAIAIAI